MRAPKAMTLLGALLKGTMGGFYETLYCSTIDHDNGAFPGRVYPEGVALVETDH